MEYEIEINGTRIKLERLSNGKFKKPDIVKSFSGFHSYQPKPAWECIIVAQKPMKHKTYVDNALAYYDGENINAGCVNIDDCRIPFESENDFKSCGWEKMDKKHIGKKQAKGGDNRWTTGMTFQGRVGTTKGRFPANLLVQDDVLNDGVERETHSTGSKKYIRL